MQVHKADGGGGVIWGWATVNGLKCAMIGMNTEKVLTRPKTMGVWRESENRYIKKKKKKDVMNYNHV